MDIVVCIKRCAASDRNKDVAKIINILTILAGILLSEVIFMNACFAGKTNINHFATFLSEMGDS